MLTCPVAQVTAITRGLCAYVLSILGQITSFQESYYCFICGWRLDITIEQIGMYRVAGSMYESLANLDAVSKDTSASGSSCLNVHHAGGGVL